MCTQSFLSPLPGTGVRMSDNSQYILPNSTGICLLDCSVAFDKLTDRERKYAHYISQAAWYGGLVVLVQVVYSLFVVH